MPQSKSKNGSLELGALLAGRYRIEQHVGSGGYANLYRALDLTLGRERAIKEIFDSDSGIRHQFEVEAHMLMTSSHPNIPRGFDLFEQGPRMYLVMEYVHGRDLEDVLNESLVQRKRPLDEIQVLRWAIELCGALSELHSQDPPIIHRNIKPANIIITTTENKPVLIDFGLAKLNTVGPTATAAQGVTPGFAPPEQYMAKGRTDQRTDIYALGGTIYACLTGRDAPDAPARLLAQTGVAHAGGALIDPRNMPGGAGISEETSRLIVKALNLSPPQRQQSAREMRTELLAALDGLTANPTVRQPRVFISHSHEDDAFTERLADDLRAANVDVWVDTTGVARGDFQDTINAELSRREWLVLVLTPNALRSPWVHLEVNAAMKLKLAGRMKDIIPILAAPCNLSDIPPTWDLLHRFDATADYSSALTGVVGAVRAKSI